ncbi:DUF349 domain-containing protein [Arhodomonas aquaeolei]|uniref:DUF349 domain-containing protein n=1 Tax=Arhodomonas aquaeolei TaxID=2369 RepID=UPI002168AA28|nr:DUF349 domain-containing protein [Arhodomonas aquaeolei]MCS4503154.1 DUF349 domain-containing protein [Arhodomonas aquaeolei]
MLFERFRRPRWAHRDPEVRRAAVIALDIADEEQGGTLARLAEDDPDAGVRAAAVRRLDDLALLERALDGDPEAPVRECARARYCQLLTGGDTLSMAHRESALQACADPQIIAHVARGAREEGLRRLALERTTDPGVLAEAALHDPVARLRQLALERIDDEPTLREIADRGRALDRRIVRLARQRLDAIMEAREAERDARAVLEDLCRRLEGLAEVPAGRETAAERERIGNRYDALPPLDVPDLIERFERAWAAIGEALERAGREAAAGDAEAPPAGAAANAPAAVGAGEVMAELEAAGAPSMERLNRLERAVGEGRYADGDEARRARLWLEAGRRYVTLAERLSDPGGDLHSLTELAERLNWPEELPSPPEVTALHGAIRERRQAADEARKDERADNERSAALEALDAALDAADEALSAGELRRSRRAVGQVRRALEDVPGSLDPGRDRRVARVRARLAELRDWRHFAVAPKQEGLCEAMEALGQGDGLEPEARLARIGELFEEWKATGGSDSAGTRALWQRFQTAAEQARESCREWQEAEAARREANREGRQTVCGQLERFLDETDTDTLALAELERIRRTARDDWRGFAPVDRRGTRGLTRRFEGLMNTLSERIDARREQAREAKTALVAEAEALAEADDPERAAEHAKALQERWKASESARPKDERALWRAFRAACDRIFERRDAARRTRRAEGDDRIAQGERVCEAVEALIPSEGGERPADGEIAAAVADARARLEAAGLPDSRRGHGVRRRFERACATLDALAGEQRAQARVALLPRLEAVLDGTGHTDALEGLPEDEPLLEPLREAVAGRLAPQPPAPHDDPSQRDLCLRMEILAGLGSPEADRRRRMELQVERLSDGFGAGTDERPREARIWALVAEWYARPATDPALQARFRRAAEAAVRSLAEGQPA